MKRIYSGSKHAGRTVGVMTALLLAVTAASVSAETLMMPKRDALVGSPLVVWGVSTLPNGSTYTIDFGDGVVTPVTGVGDRSYITETHNYALSGAMTATLTVDDGLGTTEIATVAINVYNPGSLTPEALRGLGINMAIQDGLRYLWTAQSNRTDFDSNPQTSWDGNEAFTSMVTLAFENQGYSLTNDNVAPTELYQKYVVHRGLNYIFAQLFTQPLDVQPNGGDPCVGLPLGEPTPCTGLRAEPDSGYSTATAALAVTGSGAFNRTVSADIAGATNNGDFVVGLTYEEIVQRLIDTVAWGQGDFGRERGSWYYGLQSGGDGSTVGWNVLAMLDAAASGSTVPQFANDDFRDYGLPNHLNNDGSFDYYADQDPTQNNLVGVGPNLGRAGIALQGLFLAGVAAGDARVTASRDYINSRWDGTFQGSDGYGCGNPYTQNKGCAYMMFNAFKGLKLYGIQTLPNVNRPAGPGAIPANDWYADYQDYLVSSQTIPGDPNGGYWAPLGFSCCGGSTASASALAELILAPVALVLPDPTLFSSVGLSPTTAQNPVGTTHTVTAFAQSSNNTPVPGATVVFDVLTGPNNAGTVVCAETGTNSNTTNVSGKANCTYLSNGTAGTDTIQASIGALTSNIVNKQWTEDCSNVLATLGSAMYPLDHGLRTVTLTGLPASAAITKVCQDENPNFENVPAWAKDGAILGANTAQVRAERSGSRVAPGNGRVYTIKFAAASCSGSVTVSVNTTAAGLPPAVNDGSNWNSVTGVADASCQTIVVTGKP